MEIKRPSDLLRDLIRKNNLENRELVRFVFEKSDNISLWIIGLSIGGISIFANNIANIQAALSRDSLNLILLLLAISVTAGIIYRALFLYFFGILNNAIRGIDIAFTHHKTMPIDSQLSGSEAFNELVEKLKDHFGEDLSFLINTYNEIDDNAKHILYQSVVDHYMKFVDFANKDFSLALNFIADTYSKFTGIRKEKYLKKLTNDDSGKHYKWTLRLTTTFYLLYILSFIVALFVFVFSA